MRNLKRYQNGKNKFQEEYNLAGFTSVNQMQKFKNENKREK